MSRPPEDRRAAYSARRSIRCRHCSASPGLAERWVLQCTEAPLGVTRRTHRSMRLAAARSRCLGRLPPRRHAQSHCMRMSSCRKGTCKTPKGRMPFCRRWCCQTPKVPVRSMLGCSSKWMGHTWRAAPMAWLERESSATRFAAAVALQYVLPPASLRSPRPAQHSGTRDTMPALRYWVPHGL